MINAYVDLTVEINKGWSALAHTQAVISFRDMFMGNSAATDKMLLNCIVIQMLTDYLEIINVDGKVDNNYNKTIVLQALDSITAKLNTDDRINIYR